LGRDSRWDKPAAIYSDAYIEPKRAVFLRRVAGILVKGPMVVCWRFVLTKWGFI